MTDYLITTANPPPWNDLAVGDTLRVENNPASVTIPTGFKLGVLEVPPPPPPPPPPGTLELPGLLEFFDFAEVSDGTAAVNRVGSHVIRKVCNDDGPVKCPSTTGPDGLTCVQVPNGGGLRYGSDMHAEIGRGPLTVVLMAQRGINSSGNFLARYNGNQSSYMVRRDGTDLRLQYQDAPGVLQNLTLSNVLTDAAAWYLVAATFNPDAATVRLVIIKPGGVVNAVSGPYPPYYFRSQAVYIGARSGGGTASIGGPLAFALLARAVYDDAKLLELYNGGLGRKYAACTVPPDAPAVPPPFSGLTDHGIIADTDIGPDAGHRGLYWMRPYPLHLWDSALAAQRGNYVWVHSTDHATSGTPNTQGVWIGYSGSPATRPTSWTLAWPHSGTLGGTAYSQIETPHLVYRPGNPRPFHLYAHAEIARQGVTNSQQTCLRTSADLVSWTDDGIAIPNSVANNHTGYATVYGPGELPGQTDLTAYHLANSTLGTTLLTASTDPKLFAAPDGGTPLDTHTVFPPSVTAGSPASWFDNLITRNGRVFGIGKGRVVESPGVTRSAVYLYEIQQGPSGRWDRPIPGRWWLLLAGTGPSPGLGYIQDARAFAEGDVVHVYALHGYYPDNGREQVRRLSFQWAGV